MIQNTELLLLTNEELSTIEGGSWISYWAGYSWEAIKYYGEMAFKYLGSGDAQASETLMNCI